MVTHDGGIGTAPDPLVWSAGALHQEASVGSCSSGSCFSAKDHLVFGILIGLIFLLLLSVLQDVALWHCTPGLLAKWVTFSGESPLACWWFGSWRWWHFLCGTSYSL